MGTLVKIVPYNADWPRLYLETRNRLEALLGDIAEGIERVGNTVVPGISNPLPIQWDWFTDLYLLDPLIGNIFLLSGVTGAYAAYLGPTGLGSGLVIPPLGLIPPGLNLAFQVTFVTFAPTTGFTTHGVGTFTLL